jgi:hypothetical protein
MSLPRTPYESMASTSITAWRTLASRPSRGHVPATRTRAIAFADVDHAMADRPAASSRFPRHVPATRTPCDRFRRCRSRHGRPACSVQPFPASRASDKEPVRSVYVKCRSCRGGQGVRAASWGSPQPLRGHTASKPGRPTSRAQRCPQFPAASRITPRTRSRRGRLGREGTGPEAAARTVHSGDVIAIGEVRRRLASRRRRCSLGVGRGQSRCRCWSSAHSITLCSLHPTRLLSNAKIFRCVAL